MMDYCLVTTIANNKSIFTRREIEAKEKVRSLYILLGRPGERKFEQVISSDYIHNCNVSFVDVKRAKLIYSPDIYALKGKATKFKPSHVPTLVPIAVPQYVLKHHRRVTIIANFFYVQRMPFLHTKVQKLKLRIFTSVENRSKSTMLDELKRVFDI